MAVRLRHSYKSIIKIKHYMSVARQAPSYENSEKKRTSFQKLVHHVTQRGIFPCLPERQFYVKQM
jgi:hypothetical protein